MTPLPCLTVLGARRIADVPVDPDAATARRWAEQELADPIYHQRESLLDRVVRWVLEQLAEAQDGLDLLDASTAAAVVGGLVLVGVAIALVVAGPLRRARHAARPSTDVFGDDRRSAQELRASADALAADGLWAEAVLDRFRAVLRALEERALLDERPGRTAHEAAEEAGARLPTCAVDLGRAGRLFDDICYGHAAARAQDDAWLREVDAEVAAARPVRHDLATVPGQSPEAAAVRADQARR